MKKNIFNFSKVLLLGLLLTACQDSAPNQDSVSGQNAVSSQNNVPDQDSVSSQNDAKNQNVSLVADQQEYKDAVKNAKPGDRIVLKNGVWNDFEMVFDAKGTKEKPITLTVQDKGKVIISGQSNLRIAGEHLVVSGLVFKNGYTPTKEVISFRRNKTDLANHTRVTEVVIDHFNNPERFERDFWVMMYGKNNRFDHNQSY